jgi:hypothetical protein
MVPAVGGVLAGGAFLLDVGHFAIRRDLAIMARHTATGEGRESEESHQTHHERAPVVADISNSCTEELDCQASLATES